MNSQDILFLDFETTSINPYSCQPIQLAAVVIHGRKLEIHNDSIFSSYIQPIWDIEECKRLNLDPINDEVLEKTKIKLEDVEKAPSIKTVWDQFVQYVNQYNYRKSKWGAPIKSGYNIDRYDSIIIDRICGGHFKKAKKELDILQTRGIITEEIKIPDPYGFGPWDNERQEETLFYPRDSIDLMRIIWMWTENNVEMKSLSFDAVRDWLGISAEGAHNAIKDVQDGAEVLIRFLKLHRHYAPKIKFKGSFSG